MRTLFSYAGNSHSIPLHEFGSTGGFANVSLAITPASCALEQPTQENTSCWEDLDHVYIGLFSYDQWNNLTRFTAWNNAKLVEEAVSCALFPAVALSSISALTWQHSTSPSCAESATCFALGGLTSFPSEDDEFVTSFDGYRTPLPPDGGPLRFDLRYALPPIHDLYTLALTNCREVELVAAGEACFVGGHGERLSSREQSVLLVHVAFLLVTLGFALWLTTLIRAQRRYAPVTRP